jgi:hypoxanthine phosphoribosyltransferase
MKRLISASEIRDLVNIAARTIFKVQGVLNTSMGRAPVVFVCLLRGGVYYFTDLTRALAKLTMTDIELEFLRPSSYTANGVAGEVKMDNWDDLKKFAGKHVWLVDEIIDSGATMKELVSRLKSLPREERPVSVSITSLLARKSFVDDPLGLCELQSNGCNGIVCPMYVDNDKWLVGYGMEDEGKCRNLKDIWVKCD